MKTNKKLIPAHSGFSLIEVMIALLVLALGILAISKLQGTLIRNGSDANKRSVAASLAQKKIDDLKSFATLKADVNGDNIVDSWTSAATWPLTQQSYEFIDDNEGGIIAPGAYSIGELDYQLSWDVTPYFYNEGVSNPASTAAATVLSRFKDVSVTVLWQDEAGVNSSVELSTVIDAYSAVNTGNDTTNTGGNAPIIPYTPKQAPDVIPVRLSDDDDGLKKETAKPLPDVSKKGFSTSTQFSTVTYNTVLDTVRREDFKTVACRCKSAGATPTSTIIKGETVWDAENRKLADVTVEKNVSTIAKTLVDDGGGEAQDVDCDVCCRDSADVGSSIFKACRLKRIDGIYRLYDPWKMIAFNVIPASYFDGSAILPSPSENMSPSVAANNIDTYSDYVTSLVRERLKLDQANFGASGVNTSFAPEGFEGLDSITHRTYRQGALNNRQLQARAVFMDYPPLGIYSDCASCAAATLPDVKEDVVPLDRVPFTEVNLTQLAGWNPDRNDTVFPDDYSLNPDNAAGGHDDVAGQPGCNPASPPARNYVTNDAIENGCETNLSRGMFYPIVSTALLVPPSQTVETRIYTSNDGIVNKKVNPSASTATATINLKVQP